MITTPEQYYAYLHQIQSNNSPSIALISGRDTLYEVDLEQRLIRGPQFLSVEKDHAAETIYFITDRYYDYIDLKDMTCIVQYIDARGNAKIYSVPFVDVQTYAAEKKMIIPWNISAGATFYAGPVEYSIKFYKINHISGDQYEFIYNLNTQVAKSSILHGMDAQELNPGDFTLGASMYDDLVSRINTVENHKDLYWTDLY